MVAWHRQWEVGAGEAKAPAKSVVGWNYASPALQSKDENPIFVSSVRNVTNLQ